jgi:hypothetical protein
VSNVFQKYAAALLPFFVLVVGASQTVVKDPTNVVGDVTFGILVLGAVLTFIVKLVPSVRWQGILKTGIAVVTTIASALLPFLLPGGFVPDVQVPIVIVAVLNAIATEFGVQIRVNTPSA